jgi:hypothetical protein
MGSREDDDYWNDLYDSAPECEDEPDHGSDHMLYEVGRWFCCRCDYDDNQTANEEAYKYG